MQIFIGLLYLVRRLPEGWRVSERDCHKSERLWKLSNVECLGGYSKLREFEGPSQGKRFQGTTTKMEDCGECPSCRVLKGSG